MSDTPPIADEIRDLIDEYLAGEMRPEGIDRLEEHLLRDAATREYFVRYCKLHTDLSLTVRGMRAGDKALQAITAMEGRPARTSPTAERRLWPGWARAPAAAAVFAVAIGATWWLARRTGRPVARPAEVAWLVNAQDCQWEGEAVLRGDLLPGRVLALQRGLAEIRFAGGADVVLEGPASLELVSSNGAKLQRGKLTARVPPSAKGFQVRSPHGKVVDLGTEVGVAVKGDGSADVFVFEGKVEAHGIGPDGPGVSLTQGQAARIDASGVAGQPAADPDANRFTRRITPPPVIVPKTLALDFGRPVGGTLRDRAGLGTGLTHRLPGTGGGLAADDPNLRLDPSNGRLEITTTKTDINRQSRLFEGEYLGFRLADLGFTGSEDFEITASIPNIPSLRAVGQFGLYAGSRSDRNIRGGLISRNEPDQYRAFLVNNNEGRDTDLHRIGELPSGNDMRLTLRRVGGKYSMTIENESSGSTSTLMIRHPEFLDRETDLYVGLFGANTLSDVRKTLTIRDLKVTVWTVRPSGPSGTPATQPTR